MGGHLAHSTRSSTPDIAVASNAIFRALVGRWLVTQANSSHNIETYANSSFTFVCSLTMMKDKVNVAVS